MQLNKLNERQRIFTSMVQMHCKIALLIKKRMYDFRLFHR